MPPGLVFPKRDLVIIVETFRLLHRFHHASKSLVFGARSVNKEKQEKKLAADLGPRKLAAETGSGPRKMADGGKKRAARPPRAIRSRAKWVGSVGRPRRRSGAFVSVRRSARALTATRRLHGSSRVPNQGNPPPAIE
ncbi:unnamed protein product, partial [Iphiclides podalirius]